MSYPDQVITPGLFISPKPVTFTAAVGTAGRVIVEPAPASPEVIGTPSVAPVPALAGGATVLDLTASSSDSVARDIILYQGKVLTTQGAGTGAITVSAQNTITRASGSFITDGWLVGDLLMVFAAPGTAQVVAGIDGASATLTAVTALTLTANGTPFASGSNVLTAGSRIVNISLITRMVIPAQAGTSNSIPNVSLLGTSSQDLTRLSSEWKLGADSMLIGQMPVAVSALPAFVTVCARSVARY